MIEFKLPDLGEGIEEADVVNVLVSEGTVIQKEQNVAELETGKAVVELPCPIAGRVVKVHARAGEKIRVGEILLTIEEAEEVETHASEARKAEEEKAGKAEEQETPTGAEAPKAPLEEVEKVVAPGPGDEEPGEIPRPTEIGIPKRPPPAGPATRRMARKLGVDLHQVGGTGPGGRITPEDVEAHVRKVASGALQAGHAGLPAPPLPDFSQWGPIERTPLTGIHRKTAEVTSLSWRVIPHVTQFDSADITELESARKRYIEGHEGEAKVTLTVLALKAALAALKAFPQFNASLDAGPGVLILKNYYHLGIAVDTDQGLVVPVIRDVDRKSILELADELQNLSEKARSRKLGIEEMQGGTFTISNLGGIGGTNFTPIVYYPQVAILGLARAQREAAVTESGIQPRLMLPLSLSYDHRVIDGADGARFLRKVAGLLSDPMALLLEG
jgi:pyruvate dehydrogenase E2 component (dihydrolipoamide acetyltransferase)